MYIQCQKKDKEKEIEFIEFQENIIKKKGSGLKPWNSKWVVCDDTGLHFFKDYKEWLLSEKKPVVPKGSVLYKNIQGFFGCDSPFCEYVPFATRPVKGTFCFHIKTQQREYHVVGFETPVVRDNWLDCLEQGLKSYLLLHEMKMWLKIHEQMKKSGGKLYGLAKFDFEGTMKQDLSFKAGAKILITDRSDPDGWWFGKLENGSSGQFPKNFVDIILK